MVEGAQQMFHNDHGQKWYLCSTLSLPHPLEMPEGTLWEQVTRKGKEGCFIASALFLSGEFGRKYWFFAPGLSSRWDICLI